MCKVLEENNFVVAMWRPRHDTLFEKVQGRIIASQMTPEDKMECLAENLDKVKEIGAKVRKNSES